MAKKEDATPEEENKKKKAAAKPVKEKTQKEIEEETEKVKTNVKRSFTYFLRSILRFLGDVLDVRQGSDPDKTREAIIHDIEFRGANVWSLIASIFIASIGLNMNSTAVVIGAMLISPLMGPINGIGYSIAVNDLTLLIKSLKNFGVMVFLAIFTSFFYFWVSPLSAASAEIIGRTQPTLLDLFVAIFGGVAGIVSISKSERTNVIPGVAIATALIPPLCTAGYGLAEGNWSFFFGAGYLFLINSVFIALASFVMVRYLRFPYKQHVDPKREVKVKRIMVVFGILVMAPSIYMFISAIEKFDFESKSTIFIEEVCIQNESKILKTDFSFKQDSLNYIELYVIGEPIDASTIEEWEKKLPEYRLDNTRLRIYQDKDYEQQYIAQDILEQSVKTGIIEELYTKNQQLISSKDDRIFFLESEIARYKALEVPYLQIDREIKQWEPYIEKVSLGEIFYLNDSMRVDTMFSALVQWDKKLRKNTRKKREIKDKLGNWLEVRLEKDSVIVVDLN